MPPKLTHSNGQQPSELLLVFPVSAELRQSLSADNGNDPGVIEILFRCYPLRGRLIPLSCLPTYEPPTQRKFSSWLASAEKGQAQAYGYKPISTKRALARERQRDGVQTRAETALTMAEILHSVFTNSLNLPS